MAVSVQAILNRGQEFEEQEEYEKAYVLYMDSIKKHPDNMDLILCIAHITELLGKNDEAIEYWEKCLVINPSDLGAYSKLADLYYSNDRFKHYMTRAKLKVIEEKHTHAITDFKKAIENAQNDSDTMDATFMLGQMYEIVGKPHNAIEEYNKALNIEDNINIYMRLAALLEREDAGMAVDTLKRGIEKFPANQNLKEMLAIILTKQNNPEAALEHAQTYEAKAKAYLASGKNDEAFECIQKIANKGVDYYSLLAEYYFNAKDFEQCLETIKQLEKFNALNPAPYQMKALVYEELDDKYNAYYNWGKCYSLSGKTEMALAEYLSAYHQDEKNPLAITEIVNLYETLGEKYPAIEFTEKLAAVDPENTVAYKKLAAFYDKEGDKAQAIEHLKKVLELSPHDYDSMKKVAMLYEKSKSKENALKYYEKYLSKAPVNDETEIIKKKVEHMQSAGYVDEGGDEEGLLDKIIGFFTKSKKG